MHVSEVGLSFCKAIQNQILYKSKIDFHVVVQNEWKLYQQYSFL